MYGSFNVTTSNQYITGVVSWNDYKDANSDTENYTWVHAELRLSRTNTGYSTYDYEGGFYITIDGEAFYSANTNDKKISYNSNTLMVSADKKVYHNDDGKKTITISVYGSMPNTSLSVSEQYGQATLTTIPRASGVAAGEGYIEGTLPITIYRASSSFSHTLIYAFGGLTETIATGVGESYIWTIPTSFYTQIPNSPSGVGTITCQTYSGSTLIGTSSTTFTARCNAAVCSPTLYASLNDANSNTANLTGSTQTNPVLVDYKSNALFNVTCNAKNSASITSLKINGYSYAPTVSVITLTNIAFPSITIEAVDSRGFLAYYYFQCTDSSSNNYYKRIQYVNLTTSLSTKRSTQISDDMFVTIGGNYFKGNFSDNEPNTLSLSWKVREKNGEWINGTTALVPTISETENKYNISDLELVNPISTDGTWDYKKIYEFEFTAIDKLMTVVGSDSRPKGQPNFAIYKDVALMASGNPILDYEIIDEWED